MAAGFTLVGPQLIGRQSWKSSKSEDWHPDQIEVINLSVLRAFVVYFLILNRPLRLRRKGLQEDPLSNQVPARKTHWQPMIR